MYILTFFNFKRVLFLLAFLGSANLFAIEYCDQSELYSHMKDIGSELKSLSFEIKRGKLDKVEGRVATINQLLEKSKQETPFLFSEKELEGDELMQKQAQYQKGISDLIVIFQKLDEVAKRGDVAQVKTVFSDISKSRKIGHRAFKAQCQ